MSSIPSERLYQLLPSILRIRDVERGEPLRALASLLQKELDRLDLNVRQLYDDAFIETCQEWAVPYVGDLVGVRGLRTIEGASIRAYVANTLAARRRKGTVGTLEEMVRGATGWPTQAAEYYPRIVATTHVNHVRAERMAVATLRDASGLQIGETSLGATAHTVDVRKIGTRKSRYGLSNVAVSVWRLRSYTVERASARASGLGPGFWHVSPLGLDLPLFNRARTRTDIDDRATEADLPAPLRARALRADGELARVDRRYLGADPVLRVYRQESVTSDYVEVATDRILFCRLDDLGSLSGWQRPSTATPTTHDVAFDPETGRLSLQDGDASVDVLVTYSFASPGDIGGGPYTRATSVDAALGEDDVTWQAGVSLEHAAGDAGLYTSLDDAIAAWNSWQAEQTDPQVGVIVLMDSRSYAMSGTSPVIEVGRRNKLLVVAAEWPVSPTDAGDVRETGRLSPTAVRPHVRGDLVVQGLPGDGTGGSFVLNGVLLEGAVRIEPGDLAALRVAHSTLVPAEGGIVVEAGTGTLLNAKLSITVERSVVGPITTGDARVPALVVRESIVAGVDGGGNVSVAASAIDCPGAATRVESSTLLGTSDVRAIEASNTLFAGLLTAERRQEGCIRYSRVPTLSRAPRTYRCQPAVALAGVASDTARTAIERHLAPRFETLTFGDPAFGRLHLACDSSLLSGAEDGVEMGAFGFLQHPRRVANAAVAVRDHLRAGFRSGLLFES